MRWSAVSVAVLVATLLRPTAGRSADVGPHRITSDATLVFDGVTVIDVETGKRLQGQRVVIVGNRIKTMGDAAKVQVPAGAQVVDAHGKYLIPGLWDLHVHPRFYTEYFYPLFVVNGVTGIRDGWSELGLAKLLGLQREILAGTRVGPPRQLLAGPALDECNQPRGPEQGHTCVTDAADARKVVDSLKATGASYIKTYQLGPETYYAVVTEARKIGLPVGGHLTAVSAMSASDSGATFIDHLNTSGTPGASVASLCISKLTTVEKCTELAEHFKHNNTWFIPTLMRFAIEGMGNHRNTSSDTVLARFDQFASNFWGADSTHQLDLQHGAADATRLAREIAPKASSDSGPGGVALGVMRLMHHVGLPILAGTDDGAPVMKHMPPGATLHAELALYVTEGMTPLEALQTATLNPARAIHATDSLGTVAPGKLADLVLLDADPLTDITNTTKIRAVVANGRYFDRAAMDKLIARVQEQAPAGGR